MNFAPLVSEYVVDVEEPQPTWIVCDSLIVVTKAPDTRWFCGMVIHPSQPTLDK